MTSIRDIPYEDIKIFLEANNKSYENDAYNKVLILLKDKKAIGHTTSIIEWMIAHNLLINKVDIPHYTIDEIDNMSQDKINQLSKLLTMKGNNRDNIKNILRYLHKLYEGEYLLPEIYDIILNNLTQLELEDIDVSNLKYDDIINLLKTHRNKKEIRKFIYDNLEKIIIYNSFYFDFSDIRSILNNTNIYNKNTIIEIIMDNYEQLKNYYSDDEINYSIKEAKENNNNRNVSIGKSTMYDLINFTIDLIKADEIRLTRKTFDVVNKFHYYGKGLGKGLPYNSNLIWHVTQYEDVNILKTIINFMRENIFAEYFEPSSIDYDTQMNIFLGNFIKIEKYDLLVKILRKFIKYDYNISSIKNLLENLVILKKYDILAEILQLFIKYDYINKMNKIPEILQNIQNAILDKNDDLIIKYIKDSGL
jgi:hypothetical protein